jgi:transposase-like protein
MNKQTKRECPECGMMVCPKCGSEMDELYTKNWIIGGVHEGWSCPNCGHEEKEDGERS